MKESMEHFNLLKSNKLLELIKMVASITRLQNQLNFTKNQLKKANKRVFPWKSLVEYWSKSENTSLYMRDLSIQERHQIHKFSASKWSHLTDIHSNMVLRKWNYDDYPQEMTWKEKIDFFDQYAEWDDFLEIEAPETQDRHEIHKYCAHKHLYHDTNDRSSGRMTIGHQ